MKFKLGDLVQKIKGSQWRGVIVGTYSTRLTPEGYCVESQFEKGSVQIYPAAALEKTNNQRNKMIVKELIEELQKANPYSKVLVQEKWGKEKPVTEINVGNPSNSMLKVVIIAE